MELNKPLFSIIVPVYNVERYLSQCLDSLLNQTYNDFEIIAVDDVSTDNSRDIVKEYARVYPQKIVFIEHKVNTRQGGARNTGIDAAVGRYIMFLDSDDYIQPQTLQVLADAMEREQADILEFCHDQVDEQGNFLRRDYWPQWLNTPCCYQKPLLVSKMGPCNKVYRRELFTDGLIRFPVGYFYEDYWTIPKLLMRAKKIVYLNDPLYCYRQHSASTTHVSHIERNRAVLPGTDNLLAFFQAEGLAENRMAELEYLAIEHVLVNATLRVNSIDKRSMLQKELKQYMEDHFPNWRNNPHLNLLPQKKRQLLQLIDQEKYSLLHLSWSVRNRITGKVKQLAKKIIGKVSRK